jgi:hypothetical protein
MPFDNYRSDVLVMMSIVDGKLPAKPEDGRARGQDLYTLWECCCACWDRDPAKRPRISEVMECLNVGWRWFISSSLLIDEHCIM